MARALRASEINLSCLSQGARARASAARKTHVFARGPWWTVVDRPVDRPWTVGFLRVDRGGL